MKDDIIKIVKSGVTKEKCINSMTSILEWIDVMNKKILVSVEETQFGKDDFWFYDADAGIIRNKQKSFFTICGIQHFRENKLIAEQPIICQPEIGFLGIICKEFQGVMYFLMQAKVEPGNINHVQISPTIQATKSNFTRMHGGKSPKYFSYFEDAKKYTIIVDQIQSEQGARFYKKRNRNIIIRVDEDIEVLSEFKWMTLGQIKELMKIDNLVNMDTRTVLSCIPFSMYQYTDSELNLLSEVLGNLSLFKSLWKINVQDEICSIYNYINDLKMFTNINSKLVPLSYLKTWHFGTGGIKCEKQANFEVKYYDIEISGREVKSWKQPLVKSNGLGIFGLLVAEHENTLKFLVVPRIEIGVFDMVEIGPTIFKEKVGTKEKDYIAVLFEERLEKRQGIVKDNLFSEEGGRFYHEQNRNVIMQIEYIEPAKLPEGYFWMSYESLNYLTQVNNCLNIQLRNLLSIIDF